MSICRVNILIIFYDLYLFDIESIVLMFIKVMDCKFNIGNKWYHENCLFRVQYIVTEISQYFWVNTAIISKLRFSVMNIW